MVKLLDEAEIDPITEQVSQALDEAEEAEAEAKRLFVYNPNPGDLSDGGTIGGVKLRPNRDKRITQGRPAARQAWMWNGTETVLPLAWDTDGKRHDGARHYLLKRHCLCCQTGGFFGGQCRNCAKNNCSRCNASMDRTTLQTLTSGRQIRGWIIPSFYLRKEDVPYPAHFYGKVDCIFSFCPRHGVFGFLTEQDMRLHATKRHTDEYKAHMETIAAARTDRVEILERRIDELLAQQARQVTTLPVARPTPAKDKWAKARAAKRAKAAVGVA